MSCSGDSPQGTYWTIHITPEPEFSYVSFETNLSQTSYDDLVRKVVDVFKPGKFVTTLFVNQVFLLPWSKYTCSTLFCRIYFPVTAFQVVAFDAFPPVFCRAPNVAVSFLPPRSLRDSSASTASWPNSTTTISSLPVTPRTASRVEPRK